MATVPSHVNYSFQVNQSSMSTEEHEKVDQVVADIDVRGSPSLHVETKSKNPLESLKTKKTSFLSKMTKPFVQKDQQTRRLEADWMMVQSELTELEKFSATLSSAKDSFVFSKSTSQKKLAESIFSGCEEIVDRQTVLEENTVMLFSHVCNEIPSLEGYLAKLKASTLPQPPSTSNESRLLKRIEWATTRMGQSLRAIVEEGSDCLKEQTLLVEKCTLLLVQVVALVNRRAHTADYSGTGVAAGAAGVVAGAMVGAAGVIAAPATGGLSVPVAVAGKGLFLSGVAALTPSTIFLKRHNQQISCLKQLATCLESRIAIFSQKRDTISRVVQAARLTEYNLKLSESFAKDAIENQRPIIESSGRFLEAAVRNIKLLDILDQIYNSNPSVYHFCTPEDVDVDLLLSNGTQYD